MLYYLYTASTCYLAAMMILGSFRTMVAPPPNPSEVKLHSPLLKFAKNRNFSFLCATAAMFLLIPLNVYISAACAIFTVTITAIGISFDRDGTCGCFGTKKNLSKQSTRLVRALSLLSGAFVISYATFRQQTPDIAFDWPRLVAATVLFTYCFFELRRTHSVKPRPSLKEHLDQKYNRWQPDQFIGFDARGNSVHLRDIISTRKALFLLNLSENCEHCLALLPDIKNLAKGFSHSVTIVVIKQERTLSEAHAPYLTLFDPDRNIYSAIKAQGSPFALLLDSTTLKQLSPAAFGSDKVRILFALALNLIARTNMDAI